MKLRCSPLVLYVLFFTLTEGENGFKTGAKISPFEIFPSNTLPTDSQVSIFLPRNTIKAFYFLSTVNNGSLSITVATCSSHIQWSFQKNTNDSHDYFSSRMLWTVDDVSTIQFISVRGLYRLDFVAPENETDIHIFISTEIGGPAALQNAKTSKIHINEKRKKIIVKWQPSLVDPQNTEYSIVIDNKKMYKNLCRAYFDKKYIIFGDDTFPRIVEVGKRLRYSLENFTKHETYYLSLFATNKQNNFTYLFDVALTKGRIKPFTLNDGKLMYLNLRKTEGEVELVFKALRFNNGDVLRIFVAPCSSKIKVKIYNKGKNILTKNVTKYSIIFINSVENASRYLIKISAANNQDLENNSVVQILATSKRNHVLPFPLMPSDTKIREYESMKSCNGVTLAWYPPLSTEFGNYCFFVKEGLIEDIKERQFNRCGFHEKIRTSDDFVIRYCKNVSHRNQNVAIERINYLLPGRHYVVQIVVKKPQGKSLSYDLFQTRTLQTCSKYLL